MKVIVTAPLPPPVGGIAKWASDLNGIRTKNNWEFHVLKTNDKDVEIYQEIDKHHYIRDIKRCFSIWHNLRKQLKDSNVKIVHANIPTNFLSMFRELISSLITKIYGKKFVVHFHCTVPKKIYNKRILIMMKILCNFSKYVFVLNQQSYDFIKANTRANVFLIPNFVSLEMIKNEKKTRKKIKTFLYVGGIVEIKGCGLIIEAAKKFPEYEFRMVGYISNEFKNVKIPSNVVLTGVKTGKQLEQEFTNADCFLFLSHMDSEGFSIALTEAMANGLPCIATDWAANKDMLSNDGGIIVPIKSLDKVILAIKQISEDYELRKKASIHNIKTVKEKYTKDKILDIFEKSYNEIAKKE